MTSNNFPPARQWRRFVSLGIVIAFVAGIAFTAIFNATLAWTNTEDFCLSCHEMKDYNYREYQNTIHYTNRSGMRAMCSDCHVPKEFLPKMWRKIKAANEVWHKLLGSIDTPEKFAEKRAVLAQSEWRRMKANDSRECRNCHDAASFDFSAQGYRSIQRHEEALSAGQTCIDCHKGIAHQLPPIAQGIGNTDPSAVPLEVFRPAIEAAESAPE